MRARTTMCAVCALTMANTLAADRLLWHEVRLDDQGKLLSWVEGDAPYDRVVRAAWGAFMRIPVQPDGYRTYVTYPVFYGPNDPGHALYSGREWCHNPGGLMAMLTDSASLYYAYTGDRTVVDRIAEFADHCLANGTTEASDAWVSVPYACSDAGDPIYRGATDTRYESDGVGRSRGDGRGFLEPDKVGEIGNAYLTLFYLKGDSKYLRAARNCADALVAHRAPGDESHSPWPFRVNAKTGKSANEPYCANVLGPIRLFDSLIEAPLDFPKDTYRAARAAAWRWLKKYPMRNHVWTQYFEDILTYPDYRTNVNQYVPMETARYLLLHPEKDRSWKADAKGLIDWVAATFAADSRTMAGLPEKGIQWGAEAISEQANDMDKMSSHTARFASVLALWYERTGDAKAKERAFRSFNWATYSARENGLVKTSIDEGTGYWFSDGYGDYMRHFQRGMASVPEWAPKNEDHLLGSGSIARNVVYGIDSIVYETLLPSVDVLRVRRRPSRVACGGTLRPVKDLRSDGYTLGAEPGGGYVLRIRHGAGKTTILF